jgi:tRNA 2-thiouridine synthesizing protein A
MATEFMELCGLKCPQPILKIGVRAPTLQKGDLIEAVADCHTFEADVRKWCMRLKKNLLWARHEENGKVRVQIQL